MRWDGLRWNGMGQSGMGRGCSPVVTRAQIHLACSMEVCTRVGPANISSSARLCMEVCRCKSQCVYLAGFQAKTSSQSQPDGWWFAGREQTRSPRALQGACGGMTPAPQGHRQQLRGASAASQPPAALLPPCCGAFLPSFRWVHSPSLPASSPSRSLPPGTLDPEQSLDTLREGWEV